MPTVPSVKNSNLTYRHLDPGITCLIPLADPGGATSARPPKGPDSFVLTYKFYET